MLRYFLRKWRRNILFRLYAVVFLAVICGTGVYIAYTIKTLLVEADDTLNERLDQLVSVMSDSLSRPLYDINTVVVTSIVKALGTTPEVATLRVLDLEGLPVAYSDKSNPTNTRIVSARRAIIYVEGARAIKVGAIELSLSRYAIDQDLKWKILHTIITNLLMTLVIVVSIYLVARKIARPFADIQDALEKLANGQTDIHLSGIGREDQIGRLSHSVRSFRDTITRLRAAERETAALLSEKTVAIERLNAVFEGSNDAVMLLTGNGIFDCNHQTLEMFGFDEKRELTGKHPADLSPPVQADGEDSRAAANLQIKFALEHGLARFEWIHRSRNGRQFPVEVMLSAFQYGDEKVLQATLRDITERKKIERAMLRLNEDLEEKITLRTRELTIAMRLAEAASIAKGEFLANMSHEIRTPMNAIIGMAYLALRTDLLPKQHDYVSKIHQAALSLLGILNDILDFSKIEAGKLDIEKVTFSMDDLLASVASVTTETAEKKQLEYIFNVPPDVPRQLVGDPLRLGQVLINLLNNAIKFTEAGEIELSCTLLKRDDAGVSLRFSVRDSGIGMTSEQQAKLFRPFSQADGSTTRKYGGTGLGLSISQHLVELMGGRIEIDSESGAGSDFHFDLRLQPILQPAPAAVLQCALKQARILVVEDNSTARKTLVEAFDEMPARVDAVPGGFEALDVIYAADNARDPYRLILTDWRMPLLDGIALTQLIRADAGLKFQPGIVLMTAFGGGELQKEAEAAGINGFLFKPISQAALLNMLTSVLASPAVRLAADNTARNQFAGTRVLLVEDNDINQQIAVELLEEVGIIADIANNGREAMEKLGADAPATYRLILMDLQMPVMDGHEAVGAIRADPAFSQIPIIAMTAHARAEIGERCLKEGMQDYLTKPINPERFYATLERWLGMPMIRRQAQPFIPEEENNISLPMLPGIDTAVGLSHVAHNQALYLQLLDRFRLSQRQQIEHLKKECNNEHYQEAERYAHTLRGIAGNIGASGLQQAAESLERLLARHHRDAGLAPALAQSLQLLDAALLTVTGGLDRYFTGLPVDRAMTVEAAAAGDKTQNVLQQLSFLLQDCSGDAPDYFAGNRSLLARLMADASLEQLSTHISMYQFAEAAQMVDLLQQQYLD